MMEDKQELLVYEEYRYGDLAPWMEKSETDTELKRLLCLWIRNRMVEVDENNEVTPMDYVLYQRMKELSMGAYGKRVKELYEKLTNAQQVFLAKGLLHQRNGASLTLYSRMLRVLLGKGSLFQDRLKSQRLTFYVGDRKNIEDAELIELVNILFLPWNYHIMIYWAEPFAVLGEEVCSPIGQIRLS